MIGPVLVLVAACGAWHGAAAGSYGGEVESRGMKSIDTWLEETPAGLSGRYVLHEESRDVTGTLDPLGDDGCEVAEFRWTDLYGSGIVRLKFNPATHCFEGTWGTAQPQPSLIWRSCTRPRVTS